MTGQQSDICADLVSSRSKTGQNGQNVEIHFARIGLASNDESAEEYTKRPLHSVHSLIRT